MPGWCSARCSLMFAIGVADRAPLRATRLAGPPRLRGEHHAGRRLERREHVRQGSAVRHRQHRDLGGRDDERLERVGERRLRRADRPGGAVPLVNMFVGEVIFGGVGSGLYGMFFYIVIAVFVAGLMVGPYARIPGQEDRGARDQDRGGRRALRAHDGAGADRALGRRPPTGSRRSTTAALTASPRRSTPTTRSRTTTAAPSPATARRTSPPSSACSRSTSAASCR